MPAFPALSRHSPVPPPPRSIPHHHACSPRTAEGRAFSARNATTHKNCQNEPPPSSEAAVVPVTGLSPIAHRRARKADGEKVPGEGG